MKFIFNSVPRKCGIPAYSQYRAHEQTSARATKLWRFHFLEKFYTFDYKNAYFTQVVLTKNSKITDNTT